MRLSSVLFVLAACGGSSTPSPAPIAHSASGSSTPASAPAPDAEPAAPPVDLAAAKLLYEQKGCLACHTTDGTAKIGGTIRGLYGTKIQLTDGSEAIVDDAFIREAILDPGAKIRAGFPPTMPSYKGVLGDDEIAALIAYIKAQR